MSTNIFLCISAIWINWSKLSWGMPVSGCICVGVGGMTVTSMVLSGDSRMIVAMLDVGLINVPFMECTREFLSICRL